MATKRKKNEYQKLFEDKQIKTDEILKNIIVNNRMGYITLSVNSIDEALSSYGVKDYELLNVGLKASIDKFVAQIPDNYPIVLELTNHKFTEEEKTAIQNAIWHEYSFGYVEDVNYYKNYLKKTVFHLVLSVIFLAYLYTGQHHDMIVQIVWIPLWVFLDTVFSLFTSVIPDLRKSKRRLVQKQTMKLIFTEKFKDEISYAELDQYEKDILENIKNTEI